MIHIIQIHVDPFEDIEETDDEDDPTGDGDVDIQIQHLMLLQIDQQFQKRIYNLYSYNN